MKPRTMMRLLFPILLAVSAAAGVKTVKGAKAVPLDDGRIDAWALSIPDQGALTIPALAAALNQGSRGEREKARAAFRWVTAHIAYDVETLRTKNKDYHDQTASNAFARRRQVCGGYAALYLDLCRRMGLTVETIRGWARTDSTNQPFNPDGLHAWNAVRIDGAWQLVDCTWGAGSTQSNRFAARFNPYYFCTPPAQLGLSHFPEDAKWQFVDPPQDRERFASRVLPLSHFFESGFAIGSLSESRARVPVDEAFQVAFTGRGERSLSASLFKDGVPVSNRCWVRSQGSNHAAGCYLPGPGRYHFQLFSEAPPVVAVSSDRSSSPVEVAYRGILSWSLEAKRGISLAEAKVRMPLEPDRRFARGGFLWAAFSHTNAGLIVPSEASLRVVTSSNLALSAFLYPAGGSAPLSNLAQIGRPTNENARQAPKRKAAAAATVYDLRAVLPAPGSYQLNLYAKDAGAPETASYQFACQWWVQATEGAGIQDAKARLPATFYPAFERLGLRRESLSQAGRLWRIEGEATLTLTAPDGVLISAGLEGAAPQAPRTVWVEREPGKKSAGWRIAVAPPQAGTFTLTVYGRGPRDAEGTLAGLVQFEVESKAEKALGRYPGTWPAYQRCGAKVIEPRRGDLEAGKSQVFKVRIPGADRALARMGADRRPLLEEADGLFTLEIVPEKGKLEIFASLDGGSQMEGLCWFEAR